MINMLSFGPGPRGQGLFDFLCIRSPACFSLFGGFFEY